MKHIKYFNNALISVFVKKGENLEKIKNTLLNLCLFNLEKEKIFISTIDALGFNEQKIKILKIYLEKQRHTNNFVKYLSAHLPDEQKSLLKKQFDSRFDEGFNFFLRLNKEKLLNDEFFITDSGNCFHIKLNIACYPKRKESAKKIIEELFN